MKYNGFELNILVKGKPITEYPHNGQVFVEGRDGSEFEIEIRNTLNERIEAVVSVDGLSVIDGKDAGPASSGYLLERNETIRIPGWKLNDTQVAAFEFAGKADSYATQMTGSNRNNGVIGVMAFAEKHRAPVFRGIGSFSNGSPLLGSGYGVSSLGMSDTGVASRGIECSTSACSTSASLSVSAQNLGTGFGKAQEFHTSTVQFERGDLKCLMVLYYDNYRGLKARGIQMDRKTKVARTQTPVAFPGMNCAPPPGWKA